MKKKKIFIIGCLSLILLVGLIVHYTIADILENDVELETDSELIYYLNVKYDGIDVFGHASSDATLSEVNSSTIYVEDKLPEGLTFTGFVTTQNGSIGAVQRDNNEISCLGVVIDDTNEEGNSGQWINNNQEFIYHGLHYNASTRTVSFKVENLKAGCVLTVGIKTQTPSTIDDPNTVAVESRRDFYNFASVREKIISTFSNVVHAYIGNGTNTTHTVTYEYVNVTSIDAPPLPPTISYPEGYTVNVAPNLYFEGYTFDGWSSNDVTISNGQFNMPNSNVVIKASFTPATAYNVTYSLTGTTPSEYAVPTLKSYYPNTIVKIDSLKAGDIVNGYRFNGWSSNDVTITNEQFNMPSSNVSVVGSFSEITYNVSYHFQGDVLPPNSDSLLPLTHSYAPGDIVTLQTISEPNGYKFLGWYKEDGFEMPEEDVNIYGEWKRFAGTFEPEISITDVSGKNYYKTGDLIRYKITVTNNESYPIKDIILKENLSDARFVEGNGYTVSNTMAVIDSIAANSSFDIYAEYRVKRTDNISVSNNIEIKGGSSNNYYELTDDTVSATITNNLQSKINICTYITGADVGNEFQIVVSNDNYDYSITLKKDECDTINVNPGTYKIFEILPQEYYLDSITGNINANNSNLVVAQGNNYNINFNNRFKSKKFIHGFGHLVDIIKGGE